MKTFNIEGGSRVLVVSGNSATAFKLAPVNREFRKEVAVSCRKGAETTQESIEPLMFTVDVGAGYRKTLWDNLTVNTGTPSIFKSVRAAWDDRDNSSALSDWITSWQS